MVEIQEAKETVLKSLEKRGFLGGFKAEIRAAVYAVLHQSNNLPLAQEDSDSDLLLLALALDLLQSLKMTHTLTVFEAEANVRIKSVLIDMH